MEFKKFITHTILLYLNMKLKPNKILHIIIKRGKN